MLLWRIHRGADASGAIATQITSQAVPANNYVSLSSNISGQNCLTSVSMDFIKVNNEYLYFEAGWVINSTSIESLADVRFNAGTSGLMFITPNFTSGLVNINNPTYIRVALAGQMRM
jgi:hypothetical protein